MPAQRLTPGEIRRRKNRGYQAERDLVKMLREMGFSAVRIPVSAPSSEPLPDIFATKGEYILAFEVKTARSGRIYFYSEQVSKLFDFLNMFKMYPKKVAVIAAKYPYKWIFKSVEEPGDYFIDPGDESSVNLKAIR